MKLPITHSRKRAGGWRPFTLGCAHALLLFGCDGDVSSGRDAGSAPVDRPAKVAEDTAPTSKNDNAPSGGAGGASGAGGARRGGAGGAGRAAQSGGPSTSGSGGAERAEETAGASGKASGDVSGSGGAGGLGGERAPQPVPSASYTVTGSWPARPIAIVQRPGSLVFTKLKVDDRFLSESCSIADYNRDGIPDISAGRRWYEGPFGPSGAAKEHVFRAVHDALPRGFPRRRDRARDPRRARRRRAARPD